MKKGFNILLILSVAWVALACNKTKSYTDMLKDERKAIDRLIDSEGLEILKHYPADGVFKENQFVKLPNDVYLNVIDSGNGKRAKLYETSIFTRFRANVLLMDTSMYDPIFTNYGPNSNGTLPVEFKYGYNTATSTTGSGSELAIFLSDGLQAGLQYVGDSSKVKLIVPFKRGSEFQNNNGFPVFFEVLEYKFVNPE